MTAVQAAAGRSNGKMKTAVNLIGGLGITVPEHLRFAAEAGFDAFFAGWSGSQRLSEVISLGKELGLTAQSVHAPFGKVNLLWEDPGAEGDAVLQTLTECLEGCSDNSVDIMVSHAYIGFGPQSPSALGVERFGRLFDRASELGVKVAVENTEG